MTSAPEHPVAPAAADVPLSDLMDAAVSAVGGSPRPGQQTMAEAVDLAMSGGRHLLVQAGTGTGKSLAYLVPALRHAVDAEKPVVVATATLALQAQIMHRDAPALLEALQGELPRPLDVALIKGRANYLCKHKIEGGFPEEDGQTLFGMADDGEAMTGMAAASTDPTTPLGREVRRLREWADRKSVV